MSIVFFCSRCGARFEVGEQAAGKTGRCKRCGERIAVPKAAPVAVAVASASPATAAADGGPGWLERVGSQVGLAPLTVGRMPGVRTRDPGAPPVDDDLGDSKPYALVVEKKRPPIRRLAGSTGPAGEATVLWRRGWLTIQRTFRRINEFAYLLSVPFLMLFLIGAATHNRGLALLGAEVVVLLNVGRVVTGLANVLAVPFRDGPATGLLFLVPPFTIKYMIDNWNKLRRPTQRVTTPILTIAAVLLAFVLLPSLSGGAAKKPANRPETTIPGR